VKDSHDRYANIEVNQLPAAAHGGLSGALAILATNLRSALDTAFLRRLRFVVAVTQTHSVGLLQTSRNLRKCKNLSRSSGTTPNVSTELPARYVSFPQGWLDGREMRGLWGQT
jgi:hypothetical protein